MINISQWRASIGLWNGCQPSGGSGGSHGAEHAWRCSKKETSKCSVASTEAFLRLLSLRHKGINNVPSDVP